ncbi:hypothetical protein ASPWEDRAFT_38690 [Aspergillus wentii DTO 134E9]|uniref:Tubby C-terminal domain-containing protein n=1 Tax=Aspergillus wentii DTO 134E9 TaxID=1073089 RepID=A0A1L9RQ42_ASPWE|nr:uncharacterized protein ASPWEDRAFT_38690 [Aspergillus wentii DTO 134E9]KAI9928459.1 hypothetical protein MW887_002504 [Aspergillus wentii]OJJ37049.1 hypothetical protein ASPWEDRAFT_38690 [Aspergillus wentii DTO 134E9]
MSPPENDSKSVASSDLSAHEDLPDGRIFHVYHTPSHFNLTVHDADKKQLFYVKNSSFRIGKPDVTFHAGEDQNAPVAAVCKFINFARHSRVGLGDPKDPNNIVWEDMYRNTLKKISYTYETLLPGVDGHHERRTLNWKRTCSYGIGEDMPSKASARNFKLIDEDGRLIAVFLNNGHKSYHKCGKLQINVDYGSQFDLMVMITGLSVLEKERRRSRNNK